MRYTHKEYNIEGVFARWENLIEDNENVQE